MGGSTTKQEKQNKSINIHEHWQTLDHFSDYILMENRMSKRLGEYRQFKLDPKYDVSTEISIYNVRKEGKTPIVRSYLAQLLAEGKKKQDVGFCGSNTHLEVITERMPYRLLELPQLTFPESYYILQETLFAFDYLYQKVGPVTVSNEMIGINQDGHVRCWVNPEWYDNHPVRESPSLLTSRGIDPKKSYLMVPPEYREEREIISNILDVISDKCEQGALPYQFQHSFRKHSHSFQQARDFMKLYAQQTGLYVPKCIREASYLHPKEEIQDIQSETFEIKKMHRTSLKHNPIIYHEPHKMYPSHPIIVNKMTQPQYQTIHHSQIYPQKVMGNPQNFPKQVIQSNHQFRPRSTTQTTAQKIPKKVNISFSSKTSFNLPKSISQIQPKPVSQPVEKTLKGPFDPLPINNARSHLHIDRKNHLVASLPQNHSSPKLEMPVSKSKTSGELRRIVKVTSVEESAEPTISREIINEKQIIQS